MITTKDIEQILVDDLRAVMDIGRIYVSDDIPDGFVEEERITVHVKQTTTGTFFNRCFVEINHAVPDLAGRPDPRLQQAERALVRWVDADHVGSFDGTWYRYGVESHQILPSGLHCHYANVRVLFEILNTRA